MKFNFCFKNKILETMQLFNPVFKAKIIFFHQKCLAITFFVNIYLIYALKFSLYWTRTALGNTLFG